MAIDRAARARRRRALRAAEEAVAPDDRSSRFASASMELDGLFNPGRRHQLARMEWVAVAKEDDRESGGRRRELDEGVVRLQRNDQPPDADDSNDD